MIMVAVPLSVMIAGALTWLSHEAIPALWKHHIEKQHVKAAKELCESKGDCDLYKRWIQQGLKDDSHNQQQ